MGEGGREWREGRVERGREEGRREGRRGREGRVEGGREEGRRGREGGKRRGRGRGVGRERKAGSSIKFLILSESSFEKVQ